VNPTLSVTGIEPCLCPILIKEKGGNMDKERDLQEECDERNKTSEEYIRAHYGNSYGPRRTYHWEVRGNELCLVEE
jgi:hypothetical protein